MLLKTPLLTGGKDGIAAQCTVKEQLHSISKVAFVITNLIAANADAFVVFDPRCSYKVPFANDY